MASIQNNLNKSAQQLLKKAQKRADRSERTFFFNASVLSVYGWQIALPVLAGVLLGKFLDAIYPHPFLSWRLNFIILGFIIGLIDANLWLKKSFKIKGEKNANKH